MMCALSRGEISEIGYILTACLVFCGAGALLAWPAAALPHLTGASHPALSSAQASWTVAALHAGQVLGAAPGALLASRIGRRAALLLCAPPMVGAWLLLALAGDGGDGGGGGGVLAMLVTGRTLGGVAVGAAFATGPLYAAEAASARLRGGAGALVQLTLSAGQLLVYCGGAWLSLRVLALTAAVLPVLFVLAFWRAPESPHWLLRKGRHERAERALRTLRGSTVTNEQIKAEINALEAFACADTEVEERDCVAMSVRERKSNESGIPNMAFENSSKNEVEGSLNIDIATETIREGEAQPDVIKEARENTDIDASKEMSTLDEPGKKKSYVTDRTFRRLLWLIFMLVLLQCFGAAAFLFPYSTHVFDHAPLSSEIGFVVLGSVQMIGALVSPWLLGYIGRRPALLTSAGIAGLAWATRVICLYLLPSPTAALVLLFLAAFANALAFASLPLLCAAELTPAPTRSAVVAAAVALFAAGSCGAAKAFEALWHADLPHVVSFMCAASCGVAAWLTSAMMPGVEGLTLPQVQQVLPGAFSGPPPLAAQHSPQGNINRSEQPASVPKRKVACQVRLGKISVLFMIKEEAGGNTTVSSDE